MAPTDFPTAAEMGDFKRMIDINDLTLITYGDFDVYPKPTVQWRKNSYGKADAWLLRMPKNEVKGLIATLDESGLLTVEWSMRGESYTRRIALGTIHNRDTIAVGWRHNPVRWSDCASELWVTCEYYPTEKLPMLITDESGNKWEQSS